MKTRIRTHVGLLLLLGVNLACSVNRLPPSQISAGDREHVERVALGIIEADNARDLERVLSYYAADAVLLPPNEPPVRGKAAIEPRYERLFDSYQPEISTTIEELHVAGDWAYVIGHNAGRLTPRSDAIRRELDDSYLMVLRNDGGTWRIARLIWHSSHPK